MNRPLFFLALIISSFLHASSQELTSHDLIRKKIPDTILRHRTLVIPDPFNARKALLRLFPGKWYDLSDSKYKNQLISWKCPSCRPRIYPDANEMDTLWFPYPGGVATRLLDVFSYTDSSGTQMKAMSFNHSDYDPDGFQTGRFSGGLVGMAIFARIESGWQLRVFQPAIGAYGSFSQAPIPHPLQIGNGQYIFLLQHVNGGPGGPFWQNTYGVALVNGSCQQVLEAYGTGRTAGFEGKSVWTAKTFVMAREKSSFRDIVIVSQGHFVAPDPERLPPELDHKVKAGQHGSFTIRHVYLYTEGKGYEEQLPAKVILKMER